MWRAKTSTFAMHKSLCFQAKSERTRARDKSAKGRERPRLWLPHVGGRAGRSRPLAVGSGAEQDRNQISSVALTDRIQICARSIGDWDEQVQDRKRHQSNHAREVASNHRRVN